MASKPVYDPLLGKMVMHDHGATAGDYLPLTGGTIAGDVNYPLTGFVMKDSNNVRWRVTVNTDGSLQTTAIVAGAQASPWLWMMGTV
jgi:hypothetical protein